MMKVVFLALAALVTAQAKAQLPGTFSYDNCDGDWKIMLTNLSISPDPIVVPGTAIVNLTVVGTAGISSPTPGDFVVTYFNDTTGEWDPVPCNTQHPIPFGSCHYDDLCTLIEVQFPPMLPCPHAFIDAGVACFCPFNPATINVSELEIAVKDTLLFFPEGTYNVQLTLYDSTGATIGCTDITLTLQHAA